MIQQQPQILQRGQAQLLEAATIHPHTVQAVAIQPQQCPIPLLPKVPVTCQQATIFHSTTVNQQALAQNGQPPMLSHSKAAPLQLTAVNVQIQPVQTQVSDLNIMYLFVSLFQCILIVLVSLIPSYSDLVLS